MPGLTALQIAAGLFQQFATAAFQMQGGFDSLADQFTMYGITHCTVAEN